MRQGWSLGPVLGLLVAATATAVEAGGESSNPGQRIGRLLVAVESVERRSLPGCTGYCLLVTIQASALARNERADLDRVVLVDVRGRTVAAGSDSVPRPLRPGQFRLRFDLPDHFAVVALELNDRRFEIVHVGPLQDLPVRSPD